jgi:hypothetical protein
VEGKQSGEGKSTVECPPEHVTVAGEGKSMVGTKDAAEGEGAASSVQRPESPMLMPMQAPLEDEAKPDGRIPCPSGWVPGAQIRWASFQGTGNGFQGPAQVATSAPAPTNVPAPTMHVLLRPKI